MIIKGTLNSKIVKMSEPDKEKVIHGKRAMTIIGGEFAITDNRDEIAIATLLGSCVAIMFHDSHKNIKAMNHFLLPAHNDKECYRYGLFSVEAMINEMYKMGCKKEHITAKIAGGANMMVGSITNNIGEKNVRFARDFCRYENIRITAEHVLGNHGRMLLLGEDFRTMIRLVQNTKIDEKIAQEDRKLTSMYSSTVRYKEKVHDDSNVTLF